ncbi:Ig-like domain-containing protein [Companilactobacillus zhongbaensis]|uniref:Ig-like domain-containing protein n=1 Tax=Companilactobacillus zhongbaensis TaxID=2486009 RepID=UPI000F7A8AFB|nr:Ig-like domain-containing protein [Companilactobacillus zhongbaensis]
MRWRSLFLSCGLILFCILLSSEHHQDSSRRTANADATNADVIGYDTPSPEPVQVFGKWITAGFRLQPKDMTVKEGSKAYLYSNFQLSSDDIEQNLESKYTLLHYWFQLQSDGSWKRNPNYFQNYIWLSKLKVGTYYFQDNAELTPKPLTNLKNLNYYSRVAKVTVVPNDIAIEDFKIKPDDDYLFASSSFHQQHSQSTTIRPITTPENATGSVKWSVDNTDLATIDNSGELFVNGTGQTGIVTVTGVFTDTSGHSMSATTRVTIGSGGLEDQTVNEGETATFDILGRRPTKDYSINWYEVGKDGQTRILDDHDFTLDVKNTTLADSGKKYYAKIIIKNANGSTQTMTTRRANLTVNTNNDPVVNFSTTIEDSTFVDPQNSPISLNKVAENDWIRLKGDVSDTNLKSRLTQGMIALKLPAAKNILISSVKLDDQPVDDYSITANDSHSILKMPAIDFVKSKSHHFEVIFQITKLPSTSFKGDAQLLQTDSAGNSIEPSVNSNFLQMNYSENDFLLSKSDVNFGTIVPWNLQNEYLGTVSDTDSRILKVNDQRRQKNPAQITVSLAGPLTDPTTGQKMNADIMLDQGGQEKPLDDQALLVQNSIAGQSLPSVVWKNNLRLKLYGQPPVGGDYRTELNWTVVNSPI